MACIQCKRNKVIEARGLCKSCYLKEYYSKNKEKYRIRWKNNPWSKNDLNTPRQRRYRKTASGKEAIRRAVRKYEAKHPIKRKSWNKASSIELQPCVKCGKFPTHRHHPDVDKPLEVVFLCPFHHKEIHKR